MINHAIVLLAIFASGPSPNSVAAGTTTAIATPAQATTSAVLPHLKEQVWEGYYKANVHVRYHVGYATWWTRWDIISRLVVIVLAVLAFAAPLLVDVPG